MMGGIIRLTSDVGHGTTVSVLLNDIWGLKSTVLM
jgi:signal transduction histidine kinase